MAIYDLSQPLENGIPYFPGDVEPRIQPTTPSPPWQCGELRLGTHSGTHLDAPSHYSFSDTLSDLAVHRFVGEGVVVDVRGKQPGQTIELGDIEGAREQLRGGRWVIFHTGWSRYWGDDMYFRHPSLALDVARALVTWGVPLVGVDMINPDETATNGGIVHEVLLGAGVLIVENLRGLEQLQPGKPYAFAILPLNIVGVDGSPVRAIAWEGAAPR